MNLFQALCGTWEPVASLLREKLKRKHRKSLSTDMRHRDGLVRSSVDMAVMAVEQRDRAIQQ